MHVKRTGQRYFFREWRKYRKLTQEQLAEAVDLTASSISQIESGKQGFTDRTLMALANALRCSPGDLLARDPLNDPPVLTIWDKISNKNKAQALRVLKSFVDDDEDNGPNRSVG